MFDAIKNEIEANPDVLHDYLFCPILHQKRNTKVCVCHCVDPKNKHRESWLDNKRYVCKAFQKWLPEEFRHKPKQRKLKKDCTIFRKRARKRGRPSRKDISRAVVDVLRFWKKKYKNQFNGATLANSITEISPEYGISTKVLYRETLKVFDEKEVVIDNMTVEVVNGVVNDIVG
jgi:hypothetical protein